jgi:hypothetical protein
MLLSISRYPKPGRTKPLKPAVLGIGSKAYAAGTEANRVSKDTKLIRRSFCLNMDPSRNRLVRLQMNSGNKNLKKSICTFPLHVNLNGWRNKAALFYLLTQQFDLFTF